ncbi:MAG TPA: aminotransferase class III-fold pyridoxal phosphate-dependent enzyme [Steroidobacteraceae bacterium]|jgi:acetylornithine/N-succinyldiaminopimelate aminotransferase|nr:aminotransferase class III-fold pyridoxal phosphate-dependent enzyme [Steroidobacteraceae bacterium]
MPKKTPTATATASGTRRTLKPTQRDFQAQVFAQYPLEVASAQGVWLTNSRGERLLDLYGGHAVAALGYGHPEWTAALARQAQECQFQSNAVAMQVRAKAARRLVRFSKLPFGSVFFVNSGAEANENALKVALRMTGRAHVAAIEGAFHGRTAGAGAVTFGAQAKWYGYPRTPFEVSFIARGDHAAITAQVSRDTAAVIVEPVQGVAGAVALGAPFLAALRARCDEVGALLIFDEVQCGMGRSGEPFAANLYGVRPDMLTAAKALGNGFPVGALMMSPLVSASLKVESLGTTFGGGPMACAAVNAVLAAMREQKLIERVRRLSAYIRRTCIVGPVTAVQGVGLLLGLRTRRPAKDIHAELIECGILAGTSADPNVLRLLPPYILEEQHVDALRDALKDLDP